MTRALPVPDTLLFLRPLDHRSAWLINYTRALYQLGGVRAALGWTPVALTMGPDDPWYGHNMLVVARALHGGAADDFGTTPVRTANHGG